MSRIDIRIVIWANRFISLSKACSTMNTLKKPASREPLGNAYVWAERTLSFEGAARLLSSRFMDGQTEDGAPHQICSPVAVQSQLDRINRLEMGQSNDNVGK